MSAQIITLSAIPNVDNMGLHQMIRIFSYSISEPDDKGIAKIRVIKYVDNVRQNVQIVKINVKTNKVVI